MLNATKNPRIENHTREEEQSIWGVYDTDTGKQVLRRVTHKEAMDYISNNCPIYGRNANKGA